MRSAESVARTSSRNQGRGSI